MRFDVSVDSETRAKDPLYDPFRYCQTEALQALVARLAQDPGTSGVPQCAELEDLLRLELVRKENHGYYLNFPCLVAADLRRLHAVCDRHGERLAAALRPLQDAFTGPVSSLTFPEPGVPKCLFFLVGCVSLDWNGLRFIDQQHLRFRPHRPGGARYTLCMEERTDEVPVNQLYFWSNSANCGEWRLTSFGGGCGDSRSRICLPDILWRLTLDIQPPDDSPHTALRIYSALKNVIATALVEAMLHRSWEGTPVGALLESLAYVKGGMVNVPLLVQADSEAAAEVLSRTDAIVADWILRNHGLLRTELGSLTPARHGVDFAQYFAPIVWHHIFGYANRHLAHWRFFFDPVGPESDFAGYLQLVG